MKTFLILLFCGTISATLYCQELRNSLLEHQFNALSLNPAYSSKVDASGFTASYFGSFTSDNLVSRSVLVNLQGATDRGGIGMSFQFFKTFFFGEANLRPAWSRRFQLENGADISVGAVFGFNYFDIDNFVLTNIENDFFSFDGGAGIYYHSHRFFAGISSLNLFEKSLGLEDSGSNANLRRENPYMLHTGGVIRLFDEIEINPVALLKFINIYELPEGSFQNQTNDFSLDLQANVFIQETYVVGLLYGFTEPDQLPATNRFGVSFTYLLDNFRLTYAIQQNNREDNAVSLPVTHLIRAGYDFERSEEEGVKRYF